MSCKEVDSLGQLHLKMTAGAWLPRGIAECQVTETPQAASSTTGPDCRPPDQAKAPCFASAILVSSVSKLPAFVWRVVTVLLALPTKI